MCQCYEALAGFLGFLIEWASLTLGIAFMLLLEKFGYLGSKDKFCENKNNDI